MALVPDPRGPLEEHALHAEGEIVLPGSAGPFREVWSNSVPVRLRLAQCAIAEPAEKLD